MILMSRGNLIMPAVAQKKPWVSLAILYQKNIHTIEQ